MFNFPNGSFENSCTSDMKMIKHSSEYKIKCVYKTASMWIGNKVIYCSGVSETWERFQICKLSSNKPPPPTAVIELDSTGLNRDMSKFLTICDCNLNIFGAMQVT